MKKISGHAKLSRGQYLFIILGAVLATLIGVVSIVIRNYAVATLPVLLLTGIIFIILIFRNPFFGLVTTISYGFLMFLIGREVGGDFPYGTGVEMLCGLTLLSVWYNAEKIDFSVLKSNLIYLMLAWLLLSIIEVINPAGASVRGWLQEIRGVATTPFLMVLLGLLLITTRRRVQIFVVLIFVLSLLAALNGLKQQYIGLWPGEQAFLDNGGATTHILGGKLRVFSFYSEAAQFGASMAQFTAFALVFAVGAKKRSLKLLFLAAAMLFFYCMMISGTRGGLFALVATGAFALFLSRNWKVILIGIISLGLFIGFLKFTTIGNGNYAVFRLRTAVNPQDASLNLRFINQRKLADYLASRPFGGGLGVIGNFGHIYNADKFLSTIEPDSYWVKLWAECGIVGFTLWFCMMMYLLGKAAGIVWRIRDPGLRVKLIALGGSAAGLFACSYGNEVMNAMPSLIVFNLSLAVIFNAARIDKEYSPVTIKT